MKHGLTKMIMTGLLCCLVPNALSARETSDMATEAEVGRCIRQAAQGRIWLEKALWGLRDQEAGWVGADIPNTNGSHDLGVLQINSGWVPRLAKMLSRPDNQIRSWLRFDPCFNAEAARWIFVSALNQTGDFWRAVGAYHSPTLWRQKRYAQSVASHLQRRFGERLFDGRDRAP